jgi:GT2 family glycosyltransferase
VRAGLVGVAILFFERAAQTLECIRSFLPAGVPIYVLNNGSSPRETRTLVTAARAWNGVTLLGVPRNVGVAAGRNLLVRRTTERWLFLADSDVVMTTVGWLAAFRAHAAAHPRTEVFVPRVLNLHDRAYLGYRRLALRDTELRLEAAPRSEGTNWFPGTACLVKRTLFRRLGLFDDKMFVGFEDFELAARALLRGTPIRARAMEDMELIHEHRPAASARERAAARVRYDVRRIARSYRRLTRKHDITFASDWSGWVARQRSIVGVR